MTLHGGLCILKFHQSCYMRFQCPSDVWGKTSSTSNYEDCIEEW
jgi:hypothetical protein